MHDYLNFEGLTHFGNKLASKFATIVDLSKKVDKVSGKGLSTNDYSTSEKNKLSGIASGAEVNQNAFSTINVNSTNITANQKTSTFSIVAGDNVILTPDVNNRKVTISTEVYEHPDHTKYGTGLYKVSVDEEGHVDSATLVTKTDIVNLGIPSENTTYSVATTNSAGLMSASDKSKLNGIATGATKVIVDESLSTTSTNAIRNNTVATEINKINDLIGTTAVATQISNAIANKSDKDHVHSASNITSGTFSTSRLPVVPATKGGTGKTTLVDSANVLVNALGEGDELPTDDSTYIAQGTGDYAASFYRKPMLLLWQYIKSKADSVYSLATHTHDADSALSSTSTNAVQNKVVNSALSGKVPTSRTVNGKALSSNITLSASDVGADPSGTAITKADAALASAKSYTDTKVANLVNSAPETLDTLGEVAAAIEANESVVDALNAAIGNKVDKVSGKGLSTNDYTTTEKNKLSGIASGAEVNQNAFSTITVGTTAISADSKTDTFTIVAGSNITLTPDTTNDKMTIAAVDTVYTHPSYTARTGTPSTNQTPAFGGTFTVSQPVSDATGHITAINSRTITVPSTAATQSAAGLMSAADKTKLDGIATGANKTVVDSAMSTTSTNPVQNKVVHAAITTAADTAKADYNKSITDLSVSGTTITYTKGDGSTGTITTQDKNTDTNVKQTVTTSNANYPLLLAPSGQTATKTTTSYFDSGVTLNPSTNTIAANISGNAASATKATNDKNDRDISRIYCSMIPAGTAIPANADINTATYLKVGNYYCSKNADVTTLTNCPTTLAFMMQVYNPLSTAIDNETTATWVYRLRKIMTHKGVEYYQFVNSGATAGTFTYGEWIKTINDTDLATASKAGIVQIGDGIGISSGVISNSGVRSIATGSTNGTISVNTNGTSADVAVKGLGSNAYTSTSYLPSAGGNVSGHIYLTGAKESSSTSNTSQLVFGTSSDNHLALSSNRGALVINPTTSATTNQIVLYLDKASIFPKGIQGNVTGNCSGSAGSVAWSGVTSKPSYYDAKAINGITRSGTTFTYTCMDGTTGTFTQQDNNTTYTAGTGLSLSGTTFNNTGVTSINGATGSVNLKFIYGGSDNDWTLRVNKSSETVSTIMLKTKHSSSLPDGKNAWSLGNKDLAGDFLLTWYDENGTWVNAGHVLHDKNFTSYVTPAKIGAAESSHNQASTTITTGGSEGQICAVNANGTISPSSRTIASLGTGATYSLNGTTLTITTL